jgi:hypothetical protein
MVRYAYPIQSYAMPNDDQSIRIDKGKRARRLLDFNPLLKKAIDQTAV